VATKRIWLPPDIYQLKLTLRGTSPPIWRRLRVPAGLTLDVVHEVLQLVMGWDDSHLHEFRIGVRAGVKGHQFCRFEGRQRVGIRKGEHTGARLRGGLMQPAGRIGSNDLVQAIA